MVLIRSSKMSKKMKRLNELKKKYKPLKKLEFTNYELSELLSGKTIIKKK